MRLLLSDLYIAVYEEKVFDAAIQLVAYLPNLQSTARSTYADAWSSYKEQAANIRTD